LLGGCLPLHIEKQGTKETLIPSDDSEFRVNNREARAQSIQRTQFSISVGKAEGIERVTFIASIWFIRDSTAKDLTALRFDTSR